MNEQQPAENEVVEALESLFSCFLVIDSCTQGAKEVLEEQGVELTDEEIRNLWEEIYPAACFLADGFVRRGGIPEDAERVLKELGRTQTLDYLKDRRHFSE